MIGGLLGGDGQIHQKILRTTDDEAAERLIVPDALDGPTAASAATENSPHTPDTTTSPYHQELGEPATQRRNTNCPQHPGTRPERAIEAALRLG